MVIFPVILAGGTGSRLWPLSREMHPKQFIGLVDKATMFQATVSRLSEFQNVQPPIIVCNSDHRFLVVEQLLEIGAEATEIILEPVGRNTAPAIACAAHAALAQGASASETLMLVLPADHVIQDLVSFQTAAKEALKEALFGNLVTFGIEPTSVHTGYGYIRAGELTNDGVTARVLEGFVEKPTYDKAARLVREGNCFWNSGMFAFSVEKYLEELKRFAPEVSEAAEKAYTEASVDLEFVRLEAEIFAATPAISVDYAVMEHTENSVVVPLNAGWCDVGSWASLSDLADMDQDGNATRGDVLLHKTKNCYIRSHNRLGVAVGVTDLIIVDSQDALLVASKGSDQDIKNIVGQLKNQSREEVRAHRKVQRPWGSFESIHGGDYDGFKVKHIIVRPGQQLSLQSHKHRAEHWVVVRGTAKVTRGEDIITLHENQSTYIPIGMLHRLENEGDTDLELIEVQSGDYLGEDDIVRYDDVYGRVGSNDIPTSSQQ